MNLPSYECILCNQSTEETIAHLFLECNVAKDCWSLIGLTVISSPDCVERGSDQCSFLHGNHYYYVLVHLGPKKCFHFQRNSSQLPKRLNKF